MLRFIKCFITFFTTITTAILMVVAVNVAISWGDALVAETLLHILISGALTGLVTALLFFKEFKNTKDFLIRSAIHYLCMCAIMITIGYWFGWLELEIGNILGMILSVTVVYAITWVVDYFLAKKEADDLNRALEERSKK